MSNRTAPDGDMRYIRLKSSGYISKRMLCDHCGSISQCEMEDKSRWRFSIVEYKECAKFQPVIIFRPPLIGLEDQFNTFRMGRAWFNRVKAGTRVALLDASKREVFGRATVIAVYYGSKALMQELHGPRNHLMLNLKFDDKHQMVEHFSGLCRRAMGNIIYENSDTASVIYMRRDE